MVFDISGGLLVNSVGLKHGEGKMFSTEMLFNSLASIPSADNRHPHFPTQFTDALGDAEARPILSNAISLSVCFKRKLRVHLYRLFFFFFCLPLVSTLFFFFLPRNNFNTYHVACWNQEHLLTSLS